MYLINTSLNFIKTITLLLVCIFLIYLSANNEKDFFKMKENASQGNVLAQLNLGNLYYYGKGITQDYKQAAMWYQKAAEQGDVDAQLNLGDMYYDGKGVTQDYKKAAMWYKKPAEQGDVDAQFKLASAYMLNETPTARWYLRGQAAMWYTKAAEQGDLSAQRILGIMYASDKSIIQDHKQAAKWWLKAAKQGDVNAQFNLGDMYYEGKGVLQSKKKSYIWNTIAAANGHEIAATKRDEVAESLSPRGLEEAQEETAKLYETINNK